MSQSYTIFREEQKNLTIYSPTVPVRGRILYLHGGGLLYGTREDLPELHLNTLTKEGFEILALDYPLAPHADLETITAYLPAAIQACLKDRPETCPWFLLGRSAGAYLALLLAASNRLAPPPSGILSWYGYGFLTDQWADQPAAYYTALPRVEPPALDRIPARMSASLDTAYSLYVYARQSGQWKNMIYQGRDKYFYLNYTLRAGAVLPCPLFLCHSMQDPDVPFAEYLALTQMFPSAKRMIVPGKVHDFDRDPDNPQTLKLLQESIAFLNARL